MCHPSAGASVIGARKPLIAYNINLDTPDVALASRIARAIRFSSGGYAHVEGHRLLLQSHNLAQVSMNLTDFEQTPLLEVFDTIRRQAAREGIALAGSEIIGLIPRRAVEMAPDYFRGAANFHEGLILENRIAQAMALQLK